MENQLLSKNDLTLLAQTQANPCVTIYAPIERDGNRSGRDELRLEQLIRQAQSMLEKDGFREQASELIKPIEDIVQQGFYQLQGEKIEGMAFFVAPDLEKTYLASYSTPEVVRVDDHFDLRPLLDLLQLEDDYFLLTISKDQMLLYHGTQSSLAPVILPSNMAVDVTATVAREAPEPKSGKPINAEANSVEFVGVTHTTSSEDREYKRINDYIRSACQTVDQFLDGKKAPLIVAAAESLQPFIEKNLHYPHLIKEAIRTPTAVDKSSQAELQEKARKLLKNYHNEKKLKEMDRYREIAGTERSAATADEILQAALTGRIEVLLASSRRNLFGRYDRDMGKVEIHKERKPSDTELISLAVMEAFNHAAKVYLVDGIEFPDDCPMGAILRW